MDCIQAILERRSCRNFLNKKVEEEKITKILECGFYAPSPVNKQPWEFIVVENKQYNDRLIEISSKAKKNAGEKSDWGWLPKMDVSFIKEVPVLIVVVGDPSRNGAEQFLEEPSKGYEHTCSASVQNMLLVAQSLGLASLWFTLFEKNDVRTLFDIDKEKDPLAIICLGYAENFGKTPSRKGIEDKVRFIK